MMLTTTTLILTTTFSDMTGEVITSGQNAKVKRLLALQQKSAERRQQGLFVVEGRRELMHCVQAGYEIDSVFFCTSSDGAGQGIETFLASLSLMSVPCYGVSPVVYQRIAYRGSTEGVVALVRSRMLQLSELVLGSAPLLIVVEGVEKPGNLGAILRSADASGADAVVVCDALTDLYNPNLIRSSIGAVFTVPTVVTTSAECISFLRSRQFSILTAQLQDSRLYYDADMRGATAIVMGTEATGLTAQWREAATAHIRIPMLGRLDSLNVSVSAAILLFEAVRQRQGDKALSIRV